MGQTKNNTGRRSFAMVAMPIFNNLMRVGFKLLGFHTVLKKNIYVQIIN